MIPNFFMKEALLEAKKAFDKGEVPVGAVIVKDGNIIARGHNLTETKKDPTAHAEILAIKQAAESLGGWRLLDCDLYVTVEPCAMCAGAIVLARIDRVYIGAMDPKAGACGSLINIPQDERLNHNVEIHTAILENDCQQIMRDFFQTLRHKKKNIRQNNQEEN
jgi:tRNA(adenine34) deaminase